MISSPFDVSRPAAPACPETRTSQGIRSIVASSAPRGWARAALVAAAFAAAAPLLPGKANFQHKFSVPPQQLDSGFAFHGPIENATGVLGYSLIMDWKVNSDSVSALVRFDDDGVAVGDVKLTTPEEIFSSSLFGAPDSLSQFIVNYTHNSRYADFGRFNFSGLAPVFTKRVFLNVDAQNASFSYLPGNRIALVQNAGANIQVAVYDGTSGAVVFSKNYASSAFLAPSPFPGLGGQSVSLQWLPNGTGYVLMVFNSEIDLGGGDPSLVSHSNFIHLDLDGAVQSANRVTFSGLSFAQGLAAVCADSSILLNIIEQQTNETTLETTTRHHLLNLQVNGQVKWQEILNGASLTQVKQEGASNDLYLAGARVTSQGENPTTDSVFVRLSSTDGSLLGQASLDCGQSEFPFMAGFGSGGLFATITNSASGSPPYTTDLVKLAPDLSAVLHAVQYDRPGPEGFLNLNAADEEVLFSTLENSAAVGLMSLDTNLDGVFECSLFTPLDKPVTNPGVTLEASSLTPAAITVLATDVGQETSTASFVLADLVYMTESICATTPATPVTLSASSGSATAFGGEVTVGVTTGAPTDNWTAVSNSAFAVVQNGAGQGNATISIQVAPNTSGAARSAVITVNNATFQVNQAAPSGQAQGNATVDPDGLGGVIEILTQVAGTILASPFIDFAVVESASSAASSLALLPGGGGGASALSSLPIQPGVLSITYSIANASPLSSRTGSIRVVDASGNELYRHEVAQTGTGGVAPTNMSARTQVGTGANILIPGFVLGGAGKSKVLVRGVGPTLSDFGLSGLLGDPQIVLFQSVGQNSIQVGQNDSWVDNQTELRALFTEIGAFDLTSNLDSAAIFELDPGAYTVQLKGANGGSGIGIVELYDLDPSGTRGLVNLSARAEVGAGDRVMIPGFVIEGNQSVQVVVRGVGPTLATIAGVAGFLPDPEIEVFNSADVSIGQNDDWQAAPDLPALLAAFTTAGAFDLDSGSKDAAILLTLSPGSYTAHIRGKGTDVGVALLEVYFLRSL